MRLSYSAISAVYLKCIFFLKIKHIVHHNAYFIYQFEEIYVMCSNLYNFIYNMYIFIISVNIINTEFIFQELTRLYVPIYIYQ